MKIEFKDHVVTCIEQAVKSLVSEKEKQPKPEKAPGVRGKAAGTYVTTKDVIKALELDDSVFTVMCVNQVIKGMTGYKSVSGCGIMRA
jgi:hypothetical protein